LKSVLFTPIDCPGQMRSTASFLALNHRAASFSGECEKQTRGPKIGIGESLLDPANAANLTDE
jgi:hypothetical protein